MEGLEKRRVSWLNLNCGGKNNKEEKIQWIQFWRQRAFHDRDDDNAVEENSRCEIISKLNDQKFSKSNRLTVD